MTKPLIIAILLMPAGLFAGETRVAVTWAHFMDRNSQHIYIVDDQLLFLHAENIDYSNPPIIPKWTTVKLSKKSLEKYFQKLIDVGITDWKDDYSKDSMLCDGLTWEIIISSESLNVKSSGACFVPDSYELVINATLELIE